MFQSYRNEISVNEKTATRKPSKFNTRTAHVIGLADSGLDFLYSLILSKTPSKSTIDQDAHR